MRLNIPKLGQELVLASDWEFTLYPERRNKAAWNVLGLVISDYDRRSQWISYADRTWQGPPYYTELRPERTVLFTVPAGTVLKVERIFIRQGAAKYDSVTFSYQHEKRRIRFWAKLDDANKIEVISDHS